MRKVVISGKGIEESDIIQILKICHSPKSPPRNENIKINDESAGVAGLVDEVGHGLGMKKDLSLNLRGLSIGNVVLGPQFMKYLGQSILPNLFTLELYNIKTQGV